APALRRLPAVLAELALVVPADPGAQVRGDGVGLALVLVVGQDARRQRVAPARVLAVGGRIERRVERNQLARYDQLPDRQAGTGEVGRVAAEDARLQLLVDARIAPEVDMNARMK